MQVFFKSISSALEKSHTLILIAIVSLALVARFWHLGSLPLGFQNDEAMNGYVGRFILENGVDLYGNPWPILYFNNFGDYPNVIPMYLSGLGTYLFGATVFAVRFPVALFGVLSVILVYIFSRWLYKPRWLALVSAICLAVMPWHIILSRATAEGITAAAVFMTALLFVFNGIDRQKKVSVLLGCGLLLFTYLLYPSFRIVVPLALLPSVFFGKNIAWKKFLGIITVLFFVMTLSISQTAWGKGRYEQTSITSHNKIIEGRSMNFSLGLGPDKILIARIFHNQPFLVAREFLRQYSTYFSPSFLTGAITQPMRYYVPEHGVLYWSFLAAIIIAVGYHCYSPWKRAEITNVFNEQRAPYFIWLIWIILVAPIPSALTLEDVPNVHRTLVLSVLFAVCFPIFYYFVNQIPFIKKSLLAVLLAGVCFVEMIIFWHFYTNLHSVVTIPYRDTEQKILVDWVIKNENTYDTIYVPMYGNLVIDYLFHSSIFDKELAGKFTTGMNIDRVGDVVFVQGSCASEKLKESVSPNDIFVDRSSCTVPENIRSVDTLKNSDTLDAYRIMQPQN